jgi:hypothetical protein
VSAGAKGHLPFKAFIAVSPPERAFLDQRDHHVQQLVKRVKGHPGIGNCTFYLGIGFTWLLVKAVASDLPSVGNLVGEIADEFGPFGMYTSTYLAPFPLKEGDAISGLALRLSEEKPDPRIKEFLPELYASQKLPEDEKRAMEVYVREILAKGSQRLDQEALQRLLVAAIHGDGLGAAAALFRPMVETERMLRDILKEAAGRLFPGGTKGLLQTLDPEKKEIKSIDTMSLGHVLKGCQLVLSQGGTKLDFQAKYDEEGLDLLAKLRNRVMHGGDLQPASEWRELVKNLLLLLDVREDFASALREQVQPHVHKPE